MRHILNTLSTFTPERREALHKLMHERTAELTAALAAPTPDPREVALVAALVPILSNRTSQQGFIDAMVIFTGTPGFTISPPAPTRYPTIVGSVVVMTRGAPSGYRTTVPYFVIRARDGHPFGLRTVDSDGQPFQGDELRQGEAFALQVDSVRPATSAEVRDTFAAMLSRPVSGETATRLYALLGLAPTDLPSDPELAAPVPPTV